jgi:putative GTP pyrophosphokinase
MNSEDENLVKWYGGKRPLYEGLCTVVQNTIENLLRNARIDYLSVTSRAKTLQSLLGKIQRKTYKNPEQEITDLAAIRVITYIESDVTKVSAVITSAFNIHPTESLDKSEELGTDRFGYRSVHFVCDLGPDRTKLPEFSPYGGLVFEVQVRTVLQHAWAEIEHDRNYKFAGVLPTHLQRRLNLLAGMLELVDREFVTLANEVDRYAQDVSEKTGAGNLDIEVNSTSLLQYLPNKTQWFNDKRVQIRVSDIAEVVIKELRRFGIKTLYDLDKILTQEFFVSLEKHEQSDNYIALLRDAMMYADIDKYFNFAWRGAWQGIDDVTIAILSEKYGEDHVRAVLENYGVEHQDEYEGEEYEIEDD